MYEHQMQRDSSAGEHLVMSLAADFALHAYTCARVHSLLRSLSGSFSDFVKCLGIKVWHENQITYELLVLSVKLT